MAYHLVTSGGGDGNVPSESEIELSLKDYGRSTAPVMAVPPSRMPIGVVVGVVEVPTAPTSAGWATTLCDCTMNPLVCFLAWCFPCALWAQTVTRARVGAGLYAMLGVYLLLHSGATLATQFANQEFAKGFKYAVNETEAAASPCVGLDWASCGEKNVALVQCSWDPATEACGALPELVIDQSAVAAGMYFLFAASIFTSALVCLRTATRTRFRHRLGIDGTVVGDCVVHCCLPCCALAQEARQADAANLPNVDCAGRRQELPSMDASMPTAFAVVQQV